MRLHTGGCTDAVRVSNLVFYAQSTVADISGRTPYWESLRHWKLTLWENSLPTRGLEPASVLLLAFQSDALPTELSAPLVIRVVRFTDIFDRRRMKRLTLEKWWWRWGRGCGEEREVCVCVYVKCWTICMELGHTSSFADTLYQVKAFHRSSWISVFAGFNVELKTDWADAAFLSVCFGSSPNCSPPPLFFGGGGGGYVCFRPRG